MKIRTKTGKILDLEKVRIRHHQNPLFTGTHEDYDDVLDALEAALKPDVEELSIAAHIAWAKNKGVEPHYDDMDEPTKEIDRVIVRAWIASFRKAAGVINED